MDTNTTTIMVFAYCTDQHENWYRGSRDIARDLNRYGVRVALLDGGWAEIDASHVSIMLRIAENDPHMLVSLDRALGLAVLFSTFWERNGAVVAERRAHPGSGGCGGRCGS